MDKLTVHSTKDIEEARIRLGSDVRRTPVWQWKGEVVEELFGRDTEVHLKLELLQYGGSFKCRGSLLNTMDLNNEELKKGVTAVSAGNHAISVAYAAKAMDTTAKVVMPQSANSAKIERCRSLGAEIVLVENVHAAFEKVKQIETEEGRTFIHPFESRKTVLGTATVGLELMQQVENLDAVIVPVGGGGLIAGIASCAKQMNAGIEVIGVEPEGADTMSRSFGTGQPESIDEVQTIADSLGSPHAAPYTFGMAQRFVDRMVTVSDAEMAACMQLMFEELKLAVEPAGASAVAALRYRVANRLQSRRIGLIVCGSNIDLETYYQNINQNRFTND